MSVPHFPFTLSRSPSVATASKIVSSNGTGPVSHPDSSVRSLSTISCISTSSPSRRLSTIERRLRRRAPKSVDEISYFSIEQVPCLSRQSNTCVVVTAKRYILLNNDIPIPRGGCGRLRSNCVSRSYHWSRLASFSPTASNLSRSNVRCMMPTMSLC